MEPRIQYAKTEDGENVGYYPTGRAPPVIVIPILPVNHLQLYVSFVGPPIVVPVWLGGGR